MATHSRENASDQCGEGYIAWMLRLRAKGGRCAQHDSRKSFCDTPKSLLITKRTFYLCKFPPLVRFTLSLGAGPLMTLIPFLSRTAKSKKSAQSITLENIRIASPCTASWEKMAGDERARHCAECHLNVYNISAMTRREAEQLITSHEGRLCLRFYRRNDGTVLTQDCPRGLRAVVKRGGLCGGCGAFGCNELALCIGPELRRYRSSNTGEQ